MNWVIVLCRVFVQFLCSYSTLPLYAIVAQVTCSKLEDCGLFIEFWYIDSVILKMGSSFNKAIFEDRVQAGLVGWAQKAKSKDASKGKDSVSDHQGSPLLKLEVMQSPPTNNNNGTAPEIKHTTWLKPKHTCPRLCLDSSISIFKSLSLICINCSCD